MVKIKFKRFYLRIIDLIIVYIAILLSTLIKFDGNIPAELLRVVFLHGIYISFIYVIIFQIFGMYKSLWEYVALRELIIIIGACFSGTIVSFAIEQIFAVRTPITVFVIAFLIIVILIGGSRISYRLIRKAIKFRNGKVQRSNAETKRAMIVGAGDAGSIIIREMKYNPDIMSVPVIVVDDDENKHGKKIQGVNIVGSIKKIPDLVKKHNIDEIIFAIPSASIENKKNILHLCAETRCNLLVIPSTAKTFAANSFSNVLRPVNIEDLLGREERDIESPLSIDYLHKKTVLITGGGGSIGSEIVRQLMNFKLKKIVILDIYENNAYELLNELRIKYGDKKDVEIVIASIRDVERLEEVFLSYKPDVVFHAAAHKHVPLMETSPCEAIKNNILGTLNVVNTADKFEVEKFVLISTDKAVNPTNIMGATKRVAEMIIQSMDKLSSTQFVAVRFGNVLGSNGSIIPLFDRQIKNGGPVTVTHADIKRYFMTIPEASRLVIQAGVVANGGEIFVLDMGEPVKIMDLALNMIRLSGLVPEVDIKINVVGLRPGEKLFEELLLDDGNVKKTMFDKIYIEEPNDISFIELEKSINVLVKNMGDSESIRKAMAIIVPTYKYNSKIVL